MMFQKKQGVYDNESKKKKKQTKKNNIKRILQKEQGVSDDELDNNIKIHMI